MKKSCGNRRPSARGAIGRNSIERFRRLHPGHARTERQPHDPELHKPTYEQGLRVERRYYETKPAWARAEEIYQRLCHFSPGSIDFARLFVSRLFKTPVRAELGGRLQFAAYSEGKALFIGHVVRPVDCEPHYEIGHAGIAMRDVGAL